MLTEVFVAVSFTSSALRFIVLLLVLLPELVLHEEIKKMRQKKIDNFMYIVFYRLNLLIGNKFTGLFSDLHHHRLFWLELTVKDDV
jgi:hypothetical protein